MMHASVSSAFRFIFYSSTLDLFDKQANTGKCRCSMCRCMPTPIPVCINCRTCIHFNWSQNIHSTDFSNNKDIGHVKGYQNNSQTPRIISSSWFCIRICHWHVNWHIDKKKRNKQLWTWWMNCRIHDLLYVIVCNNSESK